MINMFQKHIQVFCLLTTIGGASEAMCRAPVFLMFFLDCGIEHGLENGCPNRSIRVDAYMKGVMQFVLVPLFPPPSPVGSEMVQL